MKKVTSDKLKCLIRVLDNGRVMVRDFSNTEFKTFATMDKALTYVKEIYIKKEMQDEAENE